MANTKEKKGFRAGLYGVIAGVVVAVVLVVLTIFAFTTRYTAFSPEKVAVAYTDGIVQTGDGYNAYKQTLVSKNQKFGSFVINAYMAPYVNEDAEKSKIIGSGTKEEAELLDCVYNTMYDYYIELLNKYGMDDYDSVFSDYFAKLKDVRVKVIGDEYMDTEFMFGVFESNVDTYGKSLTGCARVFASDNKTITQEQTIGKYQEMFGDMQEVEVDALVDGKKQTVKEEQPVYKLTTKVVETKALEGDELDTYIADYKERVAPIINVAKTRAEEFGLENTTKEKKILFIKKTENVNTKDDYIAAYEKLDCSQDINAVSQCTLEVKNQRDEIVATQTVYVVRIGNSWYVDNTNVNTTGLYLAK